MTIAISCNHRRKLPKKHRMRIKMMNIPELSIKIIYLYNIYIYIIHIYCIYVYIDMKYHYMTCHSFPFYMCESMDFSGNGALCSSRWSRRAEIPRSPAATVSQVLHNSHDLTTSLTVKISGFRALFVPNLWGLPGLVNVQKAIENDHLEWIYPLKIVIFHSYLNLPEGNS